MQLEIYFYVMFFRPKVYKLLTLKLFISIIFCSANKYKGDGLMPILLF